MDTFDARFAANYAVRDSGCWEWTGDTNANGYGRIGRLGEQLLAHRISWEKVNGAIPDGMKVLHRCDNPPCVRPDHLFVGTQGDNVADMFTKGRQGQRPGPRGAAAWNSVLTDAAVMEIRKRYESGQTQAQIAADFHTNQTTISKVVRRTAWKHVT